jgi:hypothetical protein
VAVNVQDYPELLTFIAETLTTMSHGEMPGMQPESTKAGAKHGEYRNTTHPAAVTELFVGFLRGYGRPVLVSGISKNTRDEMLWTDALVPWRRSPMWLLIKVTLHLLLSRKSQGSDRMYKGVMIYVLGHIVDMARECLAPSDCLYAMSAKIVRRLHKLRCSEEPGVAQPEKLLSWVDDAALQRTSVMISGRWRKIQKKDTRSLNVNVLPKLDIRRDTQVPLPALDDYIASMQLRSKATALKKLLSSSTSDTTRANCPSVAVGDSPAGLSSHYCQPAALRATDRAKPRRMAFSRTQAHPTRLPQALCPHDAVSRFSQQALLAQSRGNIYHDSHDLRALGCL